MIGRALALAAVLAAPVGAAPAQAETFKGADFLRWEDESRELFMDSAILMAGSVASLNTSNQGRCIYDWYFSNNINEVRQSILDFMRQYPDHPPTGVIIAVAQKRCGTFRFREK